MSSAIGLHSGAFFVGRSELLSWINSFLSLEYTKIEEMSNGAAYCQLADALWPGTVPMSRVNFDAKYEYEMVKNYKVLQSAFDRHSVDKVIDVEKLIKGKSMDNLEFLQWLKYYFEQNSPPNMEYDAVARRKGRMAPRGNALPGSSSGGPGPSNRGSNRRARGGASTGAKRTGPRRTNPNSTNTTTSSTGSTSNSRGSAPSGPSAAQTQAAAAENAEMKRQVADLKLVVDALEKERDFYFGKLREIEIICQEREKENNPVLTEIQDILYATDEDFVIEADVEATA